jgi:hypothetical protein
MVAKVGLLTFRVNAPPAVIVLPLKAEVAALVPPVSVTEPLVLEILFPVAAVPKLKS